MIVVHEQLFPKFWLRLGIALVCLRFDYWLSDLSQKLNIRLRQQKVDEGVCQGGSGIVLILKYKRLPMDFFVFVTIELNCCR